MARGRQDGKPTIRVTLTEKSLEKFKPQSKPFNIWDLQQRGLVLTIYPNQRRTFRLYYSRRGKPVWYTIDNRGIPFDEIRKRTARLLVDITDGKDPHADRQAARLVSETFADLAIAYVEQYAKKKNKSWKQAADLVKTNVLPRWAELTASAITRSDVKSLMASISSPSVANQSLAHASAIFSWAIKEEVAGVKLNPCKKITRNEKSSRERVLSNSEIPLFWEKFGELGLGGVALKVLLLTGQRPGEVEHMRTEHIVDGWWEMPGKPVPKLNWEGTKNGANHRVWLPKPVQELLKEVGGQGSIFLKLGDLSRVMKPICAQLELKEKATPHDLRRTHGTKITKLKFGRDAMNRIQNHRDGGIASVYDRHGYEDENKTIMETVAKHILHLIEPQASNIVELKKA